MAYFLYGEDTYRSWQKLQDIKKKYVDASSGDTDLAVLDGATMSGSDFASQISILPFLAKSRLIIVKNLLKEGKKDVVEVVLEQLPKAPKSTVLFFYEAGQPDKRSKLFQALNQPKTTQEFPLLTGPQLQQYVTQQAKTISLNMSGSILQRFIELTGPDLWRVEQELTKLFLYKAAASDTNPVTEEELSRIVIGQPELNVFALTDAFGQRNSKNALKLLGHVTDSESSLGLLALVAGHYRNLILVADAQQQHMPKGEMAKALKLHPFVLDKCLSQSRGYTFEELRACYRYLLHIDLAAKQSIVEPLTGLTVLAKSLEDRPLVLPDLTEEAML